jgi:uncharacterized protein (TIGR02594 family)
MFNPLNIVSAIKSLGEKAIGLVPILKGNQQERDQQANDRFLAGLNTFSAEFGNRENRTWWDSFWDGFNRMPRPVIVCLVLAYFVMSYIDPTEFQVLNVALDTVPERMWWVLSAIISFFFVAREFQKSRDKKMALSSSEFNEVQRRIKDLRGGGSEQAAASEQVETPSLPMWYVIAREEMTNGVKEITGEKHNPRILQYHKATSLKATDDETAWCSAFANWCMQTAGLKGSGSAAARSWLDWGKKLEEPKEGCIVVFKRGSQPWQGHVGFFAGFDGDNVLTLGGNQGNEVKIAPYAKNRVLGYRWPA